MEKGIERIFRFIEMVGITALIKAVIAPAYPVAGGAAVAFLTGAASIYLILPIYNYCLDAVSEGATTKKAILVGTTVSLILFVLVQVMWLQTLISVTSDLIKATISTPSGKLSGQANSVPKQPSTSAGQVSQSQVN